MDTAYAQPGTDAFNEFHHVQEYAASAVQSACEPGPLHDDAYGQSLLPWLSIS